MFLFYVTEPVDLRVEPVSKGRRGLAHHPELASQGALPGAPAEGGARIRLEPPQGGRLTESSLHLAFSRPFLETLSGVSHRAGRPVVRLLSRADQARVLGMAGMPPRLGHGAGPAAGMGSLDGQLDLLKPRHGARVAVVNPFGYALGDSVVLLTALRELRARLQARAGEVELDILQHTDNLDTEALYLGSGIIRAVHHLPAPLSLLAEYDAYVDLSQSYGSHGLPWIDEMLEMLAIDPASVPPARKRNHVPVPPETARALAGRVAPLKAEGAPLLFLHPRASTALRSIPDRLLPGLVERVVEETGWTVVSAVPLPFRHPRLVDWSPLSTGVEELAYLLSQADALLCVDTSVYHVADAVGTPGIVVFTSISPAYRGFYYPNLEGILLGGEESPLFGKSASDDPSELAFAEALWEAWDLAPVIRTLRRMVHERRERASTQPDLVAGAAATAR